MSRSRGHSAQSTAKRLAAPLKFRKYENPEEEERRIASEIEQERGKESLLNNLKGYDYKVDNKEHQRLEVHRFVDNFLEPLRTLAP
jgi:hypothetical protein